MDTEDSSPIIVRDDGRVRIELAVKPQKFRMILHAVWFLVWLIIEAGLVWTWFTLSPGNETPPRPPAPAVGVMSLVFLGAGAFVLWRGLWYWKGREIVTLERRTLTVRREIAGIGRTHRFDASVVASLRAESLSGHVIYPVWGRLFIGHGAYVLAVDREGARFYFARGIDREDAAALLKTLKGGEPVLPRERRPSERREPHPLNP